MTTSRLDFVEVSPSPPAEAFGGRKPAKSQAGVMWWWIRGKRALGEDPFEFDRWADDGGPVVD